MGDNMLPYIEGLIRENVALKAKIAEFGSRHDEPAGWQEKAAAVEQFAASEGFSQLVDLDDMTPEVACAVKMEMGYICD
jgi:hypothetical protein